MVSSVVRGDRGGGDVPCSARPQMLPVMISNPQGKSQLGGGVVGAELPLADYYWFHAGVC